MRRHPRGTGNSRGKGKRRSQFMAEMDDADLEEVSFKGRGNVEEKASVQAQEKEEDDAGTPLAQMDM